MGPRSVRCQARGGDVLFIEYDVRQDGMIELVALIEAVDEAGDDPEGDAYHAWRRTHEDGGLGCLKVGHADREALERMEDPDELRSAVEALVLADRRQKEALQ
jgi:hypothetical protein